MKLVQGAGFGVGGITRLIFRYIKFEMTLETCKRRLDEIS